jgi:hypothetical protein
MDRNKFLQILGEIRLSAFNNCYYNITKEDTEKSDLLAKRFIRHCIVVGLISEKISGMLKLDTNNAFIVGLMHDIGRFQHSRFHGLYGYKFSMNIFEKTKISIFKNIARVSLTHTLISSYEKNEDYSFFTMQRNNNPANKEIFDIDERETREIRKKIVPDDYDYIVGMADLLSVGDKLKPVLLQERLADIFERYYKNKNSDELNLYYELERTKSELEKYMETRIAKKMSDVLNEIEEQDDSEYDILNNDEKYRRVLGKNFEEEFSRNFYDKVLKIIGN